MSMTMASAERIHQTAVIGPEVELAPDVEVGPYAILEGSVRVGSGCRIEGHVCLSGPLEMGRDNFVGHGAVLGKAPQSRHYHGEPTLLRIGDHNTIREFVTIHRGTVDGGGETVLGDHNMVMVNSHIGHDVRLGDHCTLVNNTLLAGHCELHDSCILSGHSAIQQRVRIGRLAMLGGNSTSTKDIPPYVLQQGHNCVSGLNLVGMRRAGFAPEAINAMRIAFKIFYKDVLATKEALERIESEFPGIPEIDEFVAFIRSSKLGVNAARDTLRTNWHDTLDED